jgi:hypothetical protein
MCDQTLQAYKNLKLTVAPNQIHDALVAKKGRLLLSRHLEGRSKGDQMGSMIRWIMSAAPDSKVMTCCVTIFSIRQLTWHVVMSASDDCLLESVGRP